MDLKELYDQIGGNYQETISRLPSEPMVKKFVLKYPADPTYAQLQAAIAQKDWETAFRAAHTLKGVAQKDVYLSDNANVETAYFPADDVLVVFNNAEEAVDCTVHTPAGDVKYSLEPMETKIIVK